MPAHTHTHTHIHYLLSVARELGSTGGNGRLDLLEENLLRVVCVFGSLGFQQQIHYSASEGEIERGTLTPHDVHAEVVDKSRKQA